MYTRINIFIFFFGFGRRRDNLLFRPALPRTSLRTCISFRSRRRTFRKPNDCRFHRRRRAPVRIVELFDIPTGSALTYVV
jgi:hypothetical protein